MKYQASFSRKMKKKLPKFSWFDVLNVLVNCSMHYNDGAAVV